MAREGSRDPSSGHAEPTGRGKIRKVDLPGFKGRLNWVQAEDALRIQAPAERPCDYAVTFKIVGA